MIILNFGFSWKGLKSSLNARSLEITTIDYSPFKLVKCILTNKLYLIVPCVLSLVTQGLRMTLERISDASL